MVARRLWLPIQREIGVSGPKALAAQGSGRAKLGCPQIEGGPRALLVSTGGSPKGLMAPPAWPAHHGRALWALSVLPVTLGCQPVTIAGFALCFYGVTSRGRAQTCAAGAVRLVIVRDCP